MRHLDSPASGPAFPSADGFDAAEPGFTSRASRLDGALDGAGVPSVSVLSREGARTVAPILSEELRCHRVTILLVDVASGAIVDANEVAERFYGWSRDELLSRTVFDINTAPHAEVKAALDLYASPLGQESDQIALFQHRLADGSLRDIEVSPSPVDCGGRLLLCSIIHDVTERRREQARSALISQGLQGVLAGADELLHLPFNDLLRRAVELSRERLGLERCAIYLADCEAGVMRGTYALNQAGQAMDHRDEAHPNLQQWLDDSTPKQPGQRWVVSHGELKEWEGGRSVLLNEKGWIAVTLIRSSQGIIGTFHNDCAWSHSPLDRTQQELVDVYCSLLGSIIERKRVEEALRESETRLRLLAENATDLVGRVTTDGRILYLSPSCQAVLSYDPAALIGRSVLDLIHPEDLAGSTVLDLPPSTESQAQEDPFHTGNSRSLEEDDGETARRELRALNAQGEWVWLEVVSRRITSADGSISEVQFSARDVSARRRAEAAQRESDERFRLFMDNTPAMTFIKDAEGRYLYLNSAAQKIYNAPLEQMLGLTNFDRLPLSVASKLRANDLQVLETGQPHEFLEVIPDPRGRERSWLTFKFPLRDAAGNTSVGGVAIDITERREFEAALSRSEHRLSTVINSAPLVLWTLDRDGFFTTSEGQGLQAMGLKAGQVVGRSAFDVYANYPEVLDSVRRVLGGEEFHGDLALSEMTLQCRHKPLFNARGEITGSLGVAVDITERRRAEEALAQTIDRLENLLEIDRAIRAARSPTDIAQAALSRLCAQLNCCHAAVTVFNFEAGEATVLAALGKNSGPCQAQPSSAQQNVQEQAEAPQRVFNALMAGERYPLDEIVAMLAPLVVRDLDSMTLAGERTQPRGLLLTPSPSSVAQRLTNPFVEQDASAAVAVEEARAPVFWQRHRDEGLNSDPANQRRRSLPLIAGGELVGALDVESADGPMPEERWIIAREVADQLAIAIQQARLFEQVRAGRSQLQALSHRLIEAQEAERRHLARELHDEIGQVLTAVKLNLQGVSKLTERWIGRGQASASTWGLGAEAEESIGREAQGMRVRLSESVEIVEHALGQVRDLSLNLRPSLLDDLGLGPAMRWYVDRLISRTSVQVQLEIQLAPGRLPSGVETACFRVAQEALTNATRHAKARHIEIVIGQQDRWVELLIRDDGQGFDVRQARARAAGGSSLGLPGMEERAVLVGGRLSIDSAPGRGTTLHAFFPLDNAWNPSEPEAY